jgi:hypothetical protein
MHVNVRSLSCPGGSVSRFRRRLVLIIGLALTAASLAAAPALAVIGQHPAPAPLAQSTEGILD